MRSLRRRDEWINANFGQLLGNVERWSRTPWDQMARLRVAHDWLEAWYRRSGRRSQAEAEGHIWAVLGHFRGHLRPNRRTLLRSARGLESSSQFSFLLNGGAPVFIVSKKSMFFFLVRFKGRF